MYEKTNFLKILSFFISGAKVSTKVHPRKSVQRICDFNLRTPLSVMPCGYNA